MLEDDRPPLQRHADRVAKLGAGDAEGVLDDATYNNDATAVASDGSVVNDPSFIPASFRILAAVLFTVSRASSKCSRETNSSPISLEN